MLWWPAIAIAVANPAQPVQCGGVHRPGDVITCYVTFRAKSDFTSLQVQFNLPQEDKPRQHGSFINFILRDTKQIDARHYAVSGVLPDCVPGKYILAAVIAQTGNDWQQYLNLTGPSVVVENDSGDPSLIEAQTRRRELAGANRFPKIIETSPPDPATFPPIMKIGPAANSSLEPEDLVSLIGRVFRKASTSDSCGGSHSPGEHLDCRVTFQRQPQFQTVALHFKRVEKVTSHSQNQQCIGIGLGTQGTAVRGGDGAYSLTGTILRCRPGRYRLLDVGAFGYSGTDIKKVYFKEYWNGSDFTSGIVLTIKDTGHRSFPAVMSVADVPASQ